MHNCNLVVKGVNAVLLFPESLLGKGLDSEVLLVANALSSIDAGVVAHAEFADGFEEPMKSS